MCDFKLESKKAVNSLNGRFDQARRTVGNKAFNNLASLISTGKIRQGKDIFGSKLSRNDLNQGHYMTQPHYNRLLNQLDRQPHLCALCGGQLPNEKTRMQSFQPREISHRLHEKCWQAWLLGVACILGYLQPEKLVRSRKAHKFSYAEIEKVRIIERTKVKMVKALTGKPRTRALSGKRALALPVSRQIHRSHYRPALKVGRWH